LTQLWQARRWRYLLSRIDHLPRNSAYVEAVSLDEELAQQMAQAPEDKREKAPAVRMRDWSPLMEAMASQIDRLGDVVQAVIAAQGGRPPQIAPFPRPKTAWEKLRDDPRREHFRVLSKVAIQQEDGSYRLAVDPDGPLMPGLVLEPLELEEQPRVG
jgi:hypothetical protein